MQKVNFDEVINTGQQNLAAEGWSYCQLEDCFLKVFHYVLASYFKFQKCKVSNEVQSNKINRGGSTAVSVSYINK